jgi:outer membrane protein OmpA-like peptidoglycan-associated protein
MKRFYAIAIAVTIAAVLSTGCATKKYVQKSVSPVQQKVDAVDTRTAAKDAAQDTTDAELQKGVSRVDELAKGADTRAAAAASEAARANTQADVGVKDAAAARAVGEKGIARAGEVETTLGTKIENMDNFTLSSTETVLFGLSMSALDDAGKAVLDGVVSKVGSMKHFVVEVQGYTDSTGDPAFNIDLSDRRATAVVRYLTSQGKLPLFRVNTVGYGEDNPSADNKTRDGRKQNRRVEVRIFSAN